MNETEARELAEAWIRLFKGPKKPSERHPDFLAGDKMHDLIQDDPDAAWEVIQKISERDSTDQMLANLAAGPVEDLLVYHGEQFIDRLESRARGDQAFRKLLGAVWRNKISEPIWIRLQAVAGPSF